MPVPFYREIVDQIAESAYKVVLHNWGEPLLHPKIADMVAYASRKGLATELSTDLNNLRDELPTDLVRAGLGRLVVSLDGATQGSYELYRQGGTLETVLSNIARMAEAKRRMHSRSPCLEVQILVMRHNEHELEQIERGARRAGANRCELGFTIVNTLDRRQMEEWLPTDNRYSRYDASTGRDRFNQPGTRCSWLWRSLVVNWDGTVYPCCNFDRMAAEVGDLTKIDLRGLWNSPAYQELRCLFRPEDRQVAGASVPADRSICAWCRGVPRARSADEMGVY
jgi:radical SAM protein with 4Fe4S-binding SPASM domain